MRRILAKLKKYGGLIKFLKKLTMTEGYLLTQKLDECDNMPQGEVVIDLYDGSETFMKMTNILMKHKKNMMKRAILQVVSKIT